MSFNIDVDYSDLTNLTVVVKRLGKAVKDKVDEALDEWGAVVVKHIQDDLLSGQMIKTRSGKLKESVGYSHDNFLEIQVYQDADDAPYGPILSHGIPSSYPIWAHGRAMVIGGGAQVSQGFQGGPVKGQRLWATSPIQQLSSSEVLRRKVTYPGMEPHPFMSKGLEDELPALRQMITSAIEEAAAEAAAG